MSFHNLVTAFFIQSFMLTCKASSYQGFIPGRTPCNGLYEKAPHRRGTFVILQVYERVGVSLAKLYERVEKSVIGVCKRTLKG